MLQTINEIRRKSFKEVYQVYEVFQNFFGESYVDLQKLPDDSEISDTLFAADVPQLEDGRFDISEDILRTLPETLSPRPFILVYWPKVKVTNENDKSIIIYDLYAKIELDRKGNIPTENRGFTLNRSTYPIEQWVCRYMHSHIQSIPVNNLEDFQKPCLGSGPIISTINSLRAGISEGFDEVMWMLFCEELSRYVTVESLRGIPYHHLEDVHLHQTLYEYDGFDNPSLTALPSYIFEISSSELREFILWYLHNGHLAIGYQQGDFRISMSYYEYIVDISNAFIAWINTTRNASFPKDKLFRHKVLKKAIIANRQFFDPSEVDNLPDVHEYVGKEICQFKGQPVRLRILQNYDDAPQDSVVLSHKLSMYILNYILKIINYHYTNDHTRQNSDNSHPTTLPATTHQRVYYI